MLSKLVQTICCEPIQERSRAEATALGRRAASWALELGGCESTVVSRDEFGAPIWPDGWCGSVAHTRIGSELLATAVVANFSEILSLGIDIESYDRNFDPQIWRRIATPAENAVAGVEVSRATVLQLFSAKEAAYKALFPRIRRYVGFREVTIAWQSGSANSERSIEPTLSVHGYHAPLTLIAHGVVDAPSVVPEGEQVEVQLHSDGRLLFALARERSFRRPGSS